MIAGTSKADDYSPITDALDSQNDEMDTEGDELEDEAGDGEEEEESFEDVGDFVLRSEDIRDQDLQGIRQLLDDMGRFEELIEHLNENLILPYDITVTFKDGKPFEAYFDPNTEQIVLSYQFVALITGIFLKYEYIDLEDSPEDFVYVLDVVEAILYHEIGHALVHALEIPVTGKEEDAVDALSAVIISLLLEEPENLITTAHFYSMLADERDDFEEDDFWDEHSLDEQRYYNIVCWVYGSDPEEFKDLLEEEGLGENRAERCPAEYEQISSSWMTLLDPYLKD